MNPVTIRKLLITRLLNERQTSNVTRKHPLVVPNITQIKVQDIELEMKILAEAVQLDLLLTTLHIR